MIKKYILILFTLLVTVCSLRSQDASIINSLRIHTLEAFGVNTIEERQIKKNSKGDYFLIVTSIENDIFINDSIFTNDPLPEPFKSANDLIPFSVLIKINKNLELEKAIKIKNVYDTSLDIAVSDEMVILRYLKNRNVMIDGSVYPYDDLGPRSAYIKYDQDLENGEMFEIEGLWNPMDQVILDGNFMFITGVLCCSWNYFSHEEIDLVNHFYPHEIGQDTFWGGSTPFIVKYDLEKDSIWTAWKFGGLADDFVYDIEMDDEGNLVVQGISNTIGWISFDNVDSMYVQGIGVNFLVKYDASGNVIFGKLLEEVRGDVRGIFLDGKEIYGKYSYNGATFNLAETEITNYDINGDIGTSAGYVVKFDEFGDVIWAFAIEGYSDAESVTSITSDEDNLLVSFDSNAKSGVSVQGTDYISDHAILSLLNLDKEIGEVISHRVTTAGHREVDFRYIDKLEDGQIVFVYRSVSEHDLWGNVFDTWYGGGPFDQRSIDFYFLKLDLSFFTNTFDLLVSKQLFLVYPNPVLSDRILILELSEDIDQGNWNIFNSLGQVVKSGQRTNEIKIEINVADLPPGHYVIHYNDGKHMQNEMVIVP